MDPNQQNQPIQPVQQPVIQGPAPVPQPQPVSQPVTEVPSQNDTHLQEKSSSLVSKSLDQAPLTDSGQAPIESGQVLPSAVSAPAVQSAEQSGHAAQANVDSQAFVMSQQSQKGGGSKNVLLAILGILLVVVLVGIGAFIFLSFNTQNQVNQNSNITESQPSALPSPTPTLPPSQEETEIDSVSVDNIDADLQEIDGDVSQL